MKHQNKLKAIREDVGMTQQDVAVKARMTVRYYQALEAGRSLPGVRIAKRIATALGKSIEEIWEF